MKRKLTLVFALCLISALFLAGCMRNTTPSPSRSPITTPMTSVAPLPTPSPNVSPSTNPVSPAPSPSAGADASASDLSNAKKIEGELDKMTEISASTVLVHEGRALVAIEFDDAYKGELTTRITDMITEKAKAVDAAITEVTVSDDPAMMTDVKAMRDEMDGGNVLNDIKAEFDKLIQRVKPAV